MTLKDFLDNVHHNARTWLGEKGPGVSIVIGNEAADLDSMICSLFLAYYLSRNSKDSKVIPVINIPKEDLVLRTETTWLFKAHGLEKPEELLIFYPDIEQMLDKRIKEAPGNLKVILVDHNRLAEHQSKLEKFVVQIVDHHVDENRCTNAKGSDRVIELVGSASTLVAEKILASSIQLSEDEIKLLSSPILLDTVNLDPKYKKVTEKDVKVFAQLKISLPEQNAFFKKLQDERFSVASLSPYDLLRSDYKQWKMGSYEVGVSSTKRSIEDWLKTPTFVKELESYYKKLSLSVLYVMTQFLDEKDNVYRELIVFTSDEKLFDFSNEFLQKSDLELVKLEPKVDKGKYFIEFYSQKNIAASRKQLQPLLVKHYK